MNIQKTLIMSAGLIFLCVFSIAQIAKKPIDSSYYDWQLPSDNLQISPNMKFYGYLRTQGHQITTCVVASIYDKWRMNLPFVEGPIRFSENSRWVLFKTNRDTLSIIKSGVGVSRTLSRVGSYYVKGNYVIYRSSKDPSISVIFNLDSETADTSKNVHDLIECGPDGRLFVLKWISEKMSLFYLDSKHMNLVKLWHGDGFTGISYAPANKSWYFTDGNNKANLWSWAGPGKSVVQMTTLPENFVFDRVSNNGKWWLCSKQMPNTILPAEDNPAKVRIWNFSGIKSPSNMHMSIDTPNAFRFAVNRASGKIVQLTGFLDEILSQSGDYVIIQKRSGGGALRESDWNRLSQTSKSLINLTSGKMSPIPASAELSPTGKYLISGDVDSGSLQIQNLFNGRKVELCKVINDVKGKLDYNKIAWTESDERLLIGDAYDYWILDPDGIYKPRCITSMLGRKKQITFNLMEFSTPPKNGFMIVRARSVTDGSNGFYKIWVDGTKPPECLHMDKAKYKSLVNEGNTKGHIFFFHRFTNTRQSEYIITSDCKHFQVLSTGRGLEQDYNWFTSELVHFPMPDGRLEPGIFFKPEDFNPHKKYPLIFTYYMELEDCQYDLVNSGWGRGPFNIPWMLSRGYLVFIPNLVNKPAEVAKSAMDYLIAAREYLKKNTFVDTTRMGIAGHSFGGFETNYFVSHSNFFAAAYSSAGPTNMFSLYHQLPDYFPFGQFAIKQLMWEAPQVYIDNSPLLQAHRINTPLLIVGNEGDLLWPQPKELFHALRRLGKPSWLLQYEGQGHSVNGKIAELDLTTRVQQFFDYYLKGEAAPRWMVVPGSTSLQLDSQNRQPTKGLLTPEAQKIADQINARQPLKITF